MREEKVLAKGKGEMTTYFVDVSTGNRSSMGGLSSSGESSVVFEDQSEKFLYTDRNLASLGIDCQGDILVEEEEEKLEEDDEKLMKERKMAQRPRLLPRQLTPPPFGRSVAQVLGIFEEIEV